MPNDETQSLARDRRTLEFYADEASVYVASGKDGASRWLADFMAILPVGARVLDLGCGGGRDAEAMSAAGFAVDATDGSPAMAAKAAERLGRAVAVMRFDELSAVAAFDAVWANASLLHVPRAALRDVLAKIHRALKPGGIHFASYKGGGGEGRDRLGRYFNFFDRSSLVSEYTASAPWEILSVVEETGVGYDGARGPWLAITVRRPSG